MAWAGRVILCVSSCLTIAACEPTIQNIRRVAVVPPAALPLDSGHTERPHTVGIRAAGSPLITSVRTKGEGQPGDAGVRVAPRLGEISPYATPLKWVTVGAIYTFGSQGGAVPNYVDVPEVRNHERLLSFGGFALGRQEWKEWGAAVRFGFDWQAIPYSVYESRSGEWVLVSNSVENETLGHFELMAHGHAGKVVPFAGWGVRGVVRNLGYEPECLGYAAECRAPKLEVRALPVLLLGAEYWIRPWLSVAAAGVMPINDSYVSQGPGFSLGLRTEASVAESEPTAPEPAKSPGGGAE